MMTNNSARNKSLLDLARYFLKLGFIGFGGPPAHIAMMRVDLVERMGWVSAAQFGEDLATANLLPGPTSTEMTIYVGHRLRGVPGAVVAGACFILPAFLIVLLLSFLYVQWGGLPAFDALLYGIKPVALALVMHGVVLMARPLLLGWREWALLLAATVAIQFLRIDVLLVFVASGLILLGISGRGATLAGWVALGTQGAGATVADVSGWAVLWAFLKIGLVIYGGGFALIGILQQELVLSRGWLTQLQLIDGIAIGQATPGPVFTTATFVGYVVAGWAGAILATIGIFAPAFVFVIVEHRLLGWLKQSPWVKVFLRGVNVAVIASIVVAAGQLGTAALSDGWRVLIAIAALVALFRFKVAAHWLVLAAVLIGVGRWLIM